MNNEFCVKIKNAVKPTYFYFIILFLCLSFHAYDKNPDYFDIGLLLDATTVRYRSLFIRANLRIAFTTYTLPKHCIQKPSPGKEKKVVYIVGISCCGKNKLIVCHELY